MIQWDIIGHSGNNTTQLDAIRHNGTHYDTMGHTTAQWDITEHTTTPQWNTINGKQNDIWDTILHNMAE